MNSLLNKYAPFKKLVNINSNLQQNLGLLMVNKTQSLLKKKLLKKFINKKDTKYKNNYKIQNTLKVTGATLEILGKKSKLQFQLKILQLQFLTQLSLTTEPLQILHL